MKDIRIQELLWNFSEEDMAKLFPELKPEERAAAAQNLSNYFSVVARIHDKLKNAGKLDDAILRAQYEMGNKNKPASQNVDVVSEEKWRHTYPNRELERIRRSIKRRFP